MDLIEDNLESHKGVLLGLYAALNHLVSMYRWGELPVTEEEKNRTTLEFPKEIDLPFKRVSVTYLQSWMK